MALSCEVMTMQWLENLMWAWCHALTNVMMFVGLIGFIVCLVHYVAVLNEWIIRKVEVHNDQD